MCWKHTAEDQPSPADPRMAVTVRAAVRPRQHRTRVARPRSRRGPGVTDRRLGRSVHWVLAVVALAAGPGVRPSLAQQEDSVPKQPPAASPSRIALRALVDLDYVAGDAADAPPEEGFGFRRVRLIAQGALGPRSALRLMVDPSVLSTGPQGGAAFRGAPLVEAFAEHQISPALQLRAGQHRLPFGLAASTGGSSLATPEYPLATRYLVQRVSSFRDIGVSGAGRWGRIEYGAGIFNGGGINTRRDNDDSKDILGRVSVTVLPGASLAASGWRGHSGALYRAEGVIRRTFHDDADFRRWGVDARYARRGVSLSAEYLRDRTLLSRSAQHPITRSEKLSRAGWYTMAAVRPTRHLEAAARYDRWDADLDREGDATVELTAGLSWLFSETVGADHPLFGRPLNAVQRISRLMAFIEHVRPETGSAMTRVRARWEILF